MMDRRKTLMVGGGVLAAAVAVGALAGSIGIFGLSDDPPRVGKLSPIDATRSTSTTGPDADETPGTTAAATPTTGPGATVGTTATTNAVPPTTAVTAPSGDDHGGDDHDNSGPGSSHSGDDDSSGSGSGRDHPDDD
jgi:hypothetical protein